MTETQYEVRIRGQKPIPVRILGHQRNARTIHYLVERLDGKPWQPYSELTSAWVPKSRVKVVGND